MAVSLEGMIHLNFKAQKNLKFKLSFLAQCTSYSLYWEQKDKSPYQGLDNVPFISIYLFIYLFTFYSCIFWLFEPGQAFLEQRGDGRLIMDVNPACFKGGEQDNKGLELYCHFLKTHTHERCFKSKGVKEKEAGKNCSTNLHTKCSFQQILQGLLNNVCQRCFSLF